MIAAQLRRLAPMRFPPDRQMGGVAREPPSAALLMEESIRKSAPRLAVRKKQAPELVRASLLVEIFDISIFTIDDYLKREIIPGKMPEGRWMVTREFYERAVKEKKEKINVQQAWEILYARGVCTFPRKSILRWLELRGMPYEKNIIGTKFVVERKLVDACDGTTEKRRKLKLVKSGKIAAPEKEGEGGVVKLKDAYALFAAAGMTRPIIGKQGRRDAANVFQLRNIKISGKKNNRVSLEEVNECIRGYRQITSQFTVWGLEKKPDPTSVRLDTDGDACLLYETVEAAFGSLTKKHAPVLEKYDQVFNFASMDGQNPHRLSDSSLVKIAEFIPFVQRELEYVKKLES
jgi:hypothetical protein